MIEHDQIGNTQLTVAEAAKELGVRMNYVRVLLAEGLLLGTKDEKGRWQISASSVEAYKTRQRNAQSPRG